MSGEKGSHILIVDDVPGNIEVLGEILSTEYRVSFAANGEECLDLVARNCPDLILLDVVMPGIDGYEVCRRLKADLSTADIPVIFLTSLESAVDEEYGLSLGAGDFIHKPVSPPVVRARVRNHLLLNRNRLELKRHNEELEQLVIERTREIFLRDQQLIASQSATITAFCSLAEARDNDTGNHIRRTQNYVQALAEVLRNHPPYSHLLDDETIRALFRSAPLHDVGKVAIPDAILLKPGPLTASEWEIMKGHCAAGHGAIVAAARELGENGPSYLGYAAEIAYAHHERWDGTGYPRGLVGEDIPISARLMAAADVYDALISRRVYKEPFSHEESIRIMEQDRGRHFDPHVIDAMLSIAGEFDAIARRYRDESIGSPEDLRDS